MLTSTGKHWINEPMLFALYLLIVYCMTSRAQEPNCKDHTVELTGGGSSLAASLYTELGAIYSAKRIQDGQKVAISYKSHNSGYGLGRITNTIPGEPPIVFGAADRPISNKQALLNRKLVTFPTLAGALLVIYNLPEGGNVNLILSGKVLAGIYGGKITHWDDRQMKKLNEDITFSHNQIRLVVRSDNSGQTFIITGGLSKFNGIWNATHGAFSDPEFVGGICCNSMNWPNDRVEFFANGVHSMIGIVGSIPYTIGYASEANVFDSASVKHAHFMNKARRKTKANQAAVQAAMDYYLEQPRSKAFVFDLNDAKSPEAYPLALFSYMVINSSTHDQISCCQMQELAGFIEFILKADWSIFTKHHLVPLSPLMESMVMADVVQTIRCGGELAYVRYMESLKPEFTFHVWHVAILILTGFLFLIFGILVISGLKAQKTREMAMAKWLLSDRISIGGSDDSSFRNRSTSEIQNQRYRKFYYSHGEFDGNYVMLHRLNIKQSLKAWKHATQALINSMKEDIVHKNILNLVGVADICDMNHAVVEEASKGTLHFVLQTCQYEVNDLIKYNLCQNASDGLAFLHQKQIVHGQLSSINCYLDGSWMLKIAGWYQFTMMKQEDPKHLELQSEISALDPEEKEEDLIKLMYMDPEFNEQKKLFSDIFSLGLLWTEIFTRKLPFSHCSERFIQDRFYESADLMRSHIDLNEVPSNVKALIGICLGPKDDRPTACSLSEMIKKLKPTSGGVVDVIMENMEYYSSNLESKVDQQKDELTSMGRRLNDAFSKLLPGGIASSLLKGQTHYPEVYKSVTICSFTVMGFNEIKKKSASKRIKLMNDLSTLIDGILQMFEVTRVYMIGGGGYMVCSCLPQYMKKNHSQIVAEFSIALLEAMHKFKMGHQLTECISIRCGIESGPIIAGVIGTKVPQYCVFGETVETALLMESMGEPMKIHVTEKACALLQHNSSHLKLQLRGENDNKHRLKSVKTYWLAVDSSPMKVCSTSTELPKI